MGLGSVSLLTHTLFGSSIVLYIGVRALVGELRKLDKVIVKNLFTERTHESYLFSLIFSLLEGSVIF